MARLDRIQYPYGERVIDLVFSFFVGGYIWEILKSLTDDGIIFGLIFNIYTGFLALGLLAIITGYSKPFWRMGKISKSKKTKSYSFG